jgi:CubicO group peptidase (beta-lactamase class C family)
MPYDQFVTRYLFEPLGIETSRFQFIDGDERHGRHPSGALSLPAREMARIAYAMLRGGLWQERQVIPRWFVEQTGAPTHDVRGIKTFGIEAQVYSHAWELLARQGGPAGAGVPADARSKTGTGAQLIAFIPSLDLVLVRMTGSSGGDFDPAEYLRQASACILPQSRDSSHAL